MSTNIASQSDEVLAALVKTSAAAFPAEYAAAWWAPEGSPGSGRLPCRRGVMQVRRWSRNTGRHIPRRLPG